VDENASVNNTDAFADAHCYAYMHVFADASVNVDKADASANAR